MKKYVQNVFGNILKDAAKNPKEAAFIVKFGMRAKISQRRRENYKKKGKDVPKILIGSLNSNCNLFCRGCYKRSNKKIIESKDSSFSTTEWKEILKKACGLGVYSIILAGGEPLKRRDIIYEAAKVKNIIFPMFTSISLVSENDIKVFNENRNIIPVLKLEGKEKDEAEKFVNIAKAFSRNQIFYGAMININKENILKAVSYEFIDSLYNYGCKALLFTEDINKNIIDNSDRKFLKVREKQLQKKYNNILLFYINEKDKMINKCIGSDKEIFQINSKGNMNRCIYIK